MHYSMIRHHHVYHHRHRIPMACPESEQTAAALGECDWTLIEISSMERRKRSPDPMQVIGYIGLVLIVVLYLNHLDWNVPVALLNLYLSSYVLLCLRIAMSMAVLNRTMHPHAAGASGEEGDGDDASPLSFDVWAMEWYWWNAFLLRAVMSESCSGSLRLVPLAMDNATLSSSHCYSTDAALSWWTIGTVELVVLYPLCLTTCLAVLIQSPYRFALEFIVSALQLLGVLVFLAPVIAKSFVAATNDDTIIEKPLLAWTPNEIATTTHFSLPQCVYGWFGLWLGSAIWGVIPLYRLRRAVIGRYWYYEHSVETHDPL